MGNSQSTNDEKDENGTGGSKLKPLWITLGVIFGAAVTTLLAPVIISALGFGSGGIVAGSIAASMMSASAPVPAGGVVAVLQSIGAAGMGAAGITMTSATGALAGGAIATTAAYAGGNNKTSTDPYNSRTVGRKRSDQERYDNNDKDKLKKTDKSKNTQTEEEDLADKHI